MAGNESMPILQNEPGSTATFNLIRALPGTRGQYIAFDFYDAARRGRAREAHVTIVAPADATGSVKAGPNIPELQARQEQRGVRRRDELHGVGRRTAPTTGSSSTS